MLGVLFQLVFFLLAVFTQIGQTQFFLFDITLVLFKATNGSGGGLDERTALLVKIIVILEGPAYGSRLVLAQDELNVSLLTYDIGGTNLFGQ